MILPELTEDDKKFVDEHLHSFDSLSFIVLAMFAEIKNLSFRQADTQIQEWYGTCIKPVVDAHLEKHNPYFKSVVSQMNDPKVN